MFLSNWPKKYCDLFTTFISLISKFTKCEVQIFGNETTINYNNKNIFKQIIDTNV